jgi:ketosteroid isomerase-like protein
VSVDTEHRRLCHALLDAIEQGDTQAVDACYAPDMTMWCNFTGQEITREENLEALVRGRDLHRRRTYDDRIVNTFDDGFVAQYTVDVTARDGSHTTLWACLVAEVRNGTITRLFEYLDAGKFSARRRPDPARS